MSRFDRRVWRKRWKTSAEKPWQMWLIALHAKGSIPWAHAMRRARRGGWLFAEAAGKVFSPWRAK